MQKLLPRLKNVTGILTTSMKFDSTRKDLLRVHRFVSTEESSVFFIEEEKSDPLNTGSFHEFNIFQGHSMTTIPNSSKDISKFLWVVPNQHCIDQFDFDRCEMSVESEFQQLRRI